MTYESAVLADSPGWFWKLTESSGTTAADDSGNGNTGTYNQTAPGGFTLGQTGAPGVFTTAVLLSAASSGQVFSASTFTHNFPVSCDIWFKTTSATGGGLIAFGDTTFVIWVQDNGKAAIGAYDGSNFNFAASAAAYNDGAWHYMGGAYDNSTTTATPGCRRRPGRPRCPPAPSLPAISHGMSGSAISLTESRAPRATFSPELSAHPLITRQR